MKKLAAAALTLTMALAMSTPVHATIITDVTRLNDSTQIYATYEEGVTTTDTVYNVDVEWGNLEYTYHPNAEKVWSPYDLKYVIYEHTPFWTCEDGADQIKVTNHSNAAISAKLEYTQTNADVTGSFDQSKINLKSADGTTVDEAPTGTATLTLGGKMAEDAESVLGNVKVTIGDFEGERIYNNRIIMANYLNFYTTADDNVVMATGTFSFNDSLDLVGLKIGDTSYILPTKITTQYITENETIKTTLVQDSACHCGYAPLDRTVEYKYVLTINLETKELTITATANS